MNQLGKIFGIVALIFFIVAVVAVLIAVDIWILLLLGFTYDSWQMFALFIIIFGLLEFLFVMGLEAFIESKTNSHVGFHKFWGQTIVSFTLFMAVTTMMSSVAMPTVGAVIYAVFTATVYRVMSRFDK